MCKVGRMKTETSSQAHKLNFPFANLHYDEASSCSHCNNKQKPLFTVPFIFHHIQFCFSHYQRAQTQGKFQKIIYRVT